MLIERYKSQSNRVVFILVFLAVFSRSLQARDKTDVLVMNNGDRLTCEVKGLDTGTLYISLDYVDGTSSVDWSKVVSLESTQAFIVTTEDGLVYEGKLRTPETAGSRPVKIQVVENAGQETLVEQDQIVRMVATSDKFFQRFSGSVSFGAIYSKGNQSTQYTLGSQTAYVRQRWSAQANLNSNLSSSSGVSTSTHNSFGFGTRHLLPWNNWFYSGVGNFLQSSEQGIALQSTVGGGIGRYLKNTSDISLSVLGGGVWQNTNYQQSAVPINHQNLAAALIAGEVKLFKFSKTNLDFSAALMPALSDAGRVRFNTDASYYIKIMSNLKWNLTFYGNWDNRPPPGFSGSDYGTSAGLTWTFGLK